MGNHSDIDMSRQYNLMIGEIANYNNCLIINCLLHYPTSDLNELSAEKYIQAVNCTQGNMQSRDAPWEP